MSLYDFENRRGIFPGIDSRMKFCLLTLLGSDRRVRESTFSFFAHGVADLDDPERRFTLLADDFARINPNTRTCPIFRTQRDATITQSIYRRVPILIREDNSNGNPWHISFQAMFHMSNDSHLFREREELEAEGYVLSGNHYVRPGYQDGLGADAGEECSIANRYLPLYEGKMATFYDHRAADVVKSPTAAQRQRQPRYLSSAEKENPTRVALPLDWVSEASVRERAGVHTGWLLGFNDLTSATNERTTVCTALPVTAVGNKEPLARTNTDAHLLLAALNSFIVDYTARQKVGGTNMNFFHFRQLPVPPPYAFQSHADLIESAVLELVYTSWDMIPFANVLGCADPPYRWDDERRSLLRAELDALMFHLYGVSRGDTEYIMDTFTTLKRRDEQQHGEYHTKRLILNRYDVMMHAYEVTHGTLGNTPNGKNPPINQQTLATYSTRLAEALHSSYRSNIDPSPASPSCAHAESTRPSWAT